MANEISDRVLDYTPYTSLIGDIDNEIIQPDVVFRIVDNKAGNVLKGLVVAHRVLLAAASPVFRNMLFKVDTRDRSSLSIDLNDTSVEAFQLAIDTVYNKASAEVELNQLTDLTRVFELAYIADKYELFNLERALVRIVSKLSVDIDRLVEIATIADQFKIFAKVSDALFLHCAEFLFDFYKGKEKFIYEFANKHIGSGCEMVCFKLIAKVTEVAASAPSPPSPPPICGNCGADPCRNGKQVLPTVAVGTLVKDFKGVKRKIVGKSGDHVRVVDNIGFTSSLDCSFFNYDCASAKASK